jgi:hypothetical protein
MNFDLLAFLLLGVLGAAICFLGYRAFLILLPVWGMLSGIWLGIQFGSVFFGDRSIATIASWALGIILGVILAILAYWLFKIGFTLVAAVAAGAVASVVLTAFGIEPGFLYLVLLIGAMVGIGLLIRSYHGDKYAIIVLTALAGADLIVFAFLLLIGAVEMSDLVNGNLLSPIIRQSWISLAAFLILAGSGVVVQTRINRHYEYTPRIVNTVLGK